MVTVKEIILGKDAVSSSNHPQEEVTAMLSN
jgi:hypothetical protein